MLGVAITCYKDGRLTGTDDELPANTRTHQNKFSQFYKVHTSTSSSATVTTGTRPVLFAQSELLQSRVMIHREQGHFLCFSFSRTVKTGVTKPLIEIKCGTKDLHG